MRLPYGWQDESGRNGAYRRTERRLAENVRNVPVFTTIPDIPEDAVAKSLLWAEAEREFASTLVKYWLSNAQLELGEFYMMGRGVSLIKERVTTRL